MEIDYGTKPLYTSRFSKLKLNLVQISSVKLLSFTSYHCMIK